MPIKYCVDKYQPPIRAQDSKICNPKQKQTEPENFVIDKKQIKQFENYQDEIMKKGQKVFDKGVLKTAAAGAILAMTLAQPADADVNPSEVFDKNEQTQIDYAYEQLKSQSKKIVEDQPDYYKFQDVIIDELEKTNSEQTTTENK